MKFLLIFSLVFFCLFSSFASSTQKNCTSFNSITEKESMCDIVYVHMYDSYGDGWNGGTMTIINGYGNTEWTGTLLGGLSGTYSVCLSGGCYTIQVSGGSFPAEISWNIDDGTYLLAGGGAPEITSMYSGEIIMGCLDLGACNYNYFANCPDNSQCCYGNCFYLTMSDTGNNGWEGGSLQIMDNQGNVEFSYSMTSGNFNSFYGCLQHYGCYKINVTQGANSSQSSWELHFGTSVQDLDLLVSGNVIYDVYFSTSGICNHGCNNPESCDYNYFVDYQSGSCCFDNCLYVNMLDEAGDGWQGGTYTITNWKGEVVVGNTLVTGSYGQEKICLADGCYQLSVNAGTSSQFYYPLQIFDLTGQINWSIWNNTNTSFELGTIVEGCTDHTASNFNPLANCDDGICYVSCESDLDSNGQVNVADLLIFTSQFGMTCQ